MKAIQKFEGSQKTGHRPVCGCDDCMEAAPSRQTIREREACALTDIPDHARWCQTVYLSYCEHMDLMAAPAIYLDIYRVGEAAREQIKADMRDDDG